MLQPLSRSKWNYQTAAHLLSRAGFGGPPSTIRRLQESGLEGAVSHLIDYESQPAGEPAPAWAQPDPTRAERAGELRELARQLRDAPEERRKALEEKRRQLQREERRTQQERLLDLRAWWLRRMAAGPRPLEEKLTLFWHGHFATSAQKVRDPYVMWLQNETFRRHASGRWLELLEAVSKDPAMLIWLDQAQSRKQHPNENYAREVMELFALGEGNYSEKDVAEAARAFTGWSLDRVNYEFVYRRAQHDMGPKTVLGRSGNLDGMDVLEAIVRHPQSAPFIVGKLWRFFASEEPPAGLIEQLAREFRAVDHTFKPVLRRMFLCEEFYAENVLGQQVKSPVQWLVGSVLQLERELPPPAAAAAMLRALGQELFAPPNVKGWDGGLAWITTNNLLNRHNYALALITGRNPMGGGDRPGMAAMRRARPGLAAAARMRRAAAAPVDVERLFTSAERRDQELLVRAIERRFLHGALRAKQAAVLREYLATQGELDAEDILHTIHLAMCTPDYQLT